MNQDDEIKFTFSYTWALGLLIFGVLFAIASLFFPWGILTLSSTNVYLPGSIGNGADAPLPVPDFLIIMQLRRQLLTISQLIRAAIIVGCAGVALSWYVERRVQSLACRRVISYSVILASSVLSFMAVAMLALTEIGLSWGAYLALVGGVFMVLAVVMKELKVEVIVEHEIDEQGR